MSTLPIEEYALLSDCHTAALVSRHGSVDWLCFPRFDAPSVFARLLDSDAGHWTIRPAADDFVVERRYVDSSLVPETTFRTDSGTLTLTDALAVGPNDRDHDLGSGAPHALLRRVLLGNFPQAFSHIGLVNAAWAIGEAERDPEEDRRARMTRAGRQIKRRVTPREPRFPTLPGA